MDRADATLLALSLAGIASLAWATEALEPPVVALADLARWADRAVAVEAMVTRSHAAGTGAQVLQLADGTARAPAFWGASEPVEGAHVRVEGTVALHRGEWEVLARTLAVLAPRGTPLAVRDAARLAPALAGHEATVAGELVWPEDGDPALRGEGARLGVDGPRGLLAALTGEPVRARGLVRYEPARAGFVLEAWEVGPAP